MSRLRPLKEDDLDSLYAISLATGHLGGDASALYRDGRLMGHIYAAPYAVLSPQTCLAAEDRSGVAGFIVGAFDTRCFEERLERDWWPALRETYADPDPHLRSTWNDDQRRSHMIHHPRQAPDEVAATFPAHLHMNLLPRMQGRGLGGSLLQTWLSRARAVEVAGVHVASNRRNEQAIRFWEKNGFSRLAVLEGEPDDGPVWMGLRLTSRDPGR